MRPSVPIRPLPWVVAILAVAAALRLPALSVGFAMDDYAQLAMLTGAYPVERAPWDLFAFCSGPADLERLRAGGAFPWWSDPELRLSTLRPLASALVWLDVRAFGIDPRAAHVHTFAWWITMLAVVARLLLRVLPTRWALLALALYALDECHAQPLAWLANRNAILATTFGLAAVDVHVRWREGGSSRARGLSVVLLALAFACGESALGAVAFIAAHELARGRGRRAIGALWPPGAVVAVWAAIHVGGGYGAAFSGIYVDPVAEPVAWVTAAVQRGPILIADLALAIPTGVLALGGRGLLAQQVLGALALGLAVLWVRGAATRMATADAARLRWFAWAAALAVVPMVSAFVSARLLVLPAVGAHVVLAAVVLDGFDARAAATWAGRARVALAWVMLVAHGVLAPWWCAREIADVGAFSAAADRAAVDAPIPEGARVVVLVAADPSTLLYPQYARRYHGGRPGAVAPTHSWIVLSAAAGEHRLRRIDRFTLELVVPGGMLRSHVEQMFRRGDRLPAPGESVTVGEATVEVREVDDAGFPTTVRLGFSTSLDDPSWRFLLATPAGFVRYPLGPIGVAVGLPPASAPR